MDRQIEFLMHWQATCQPLIDKFVADQDRYGKTEAFRRWNERNDHYVKKHGRKKPTDHYVLFTLDLFFAAMLYVDLLIRFGVFDVSETN